MERKRILVVDDEPQIVEVLHAYFEREGLIVDSADTVAAALEKIDALRPDMLILDITLPDGSGLDVLRTVSGPNGRIPSIVLTARAEEADRIVGLELGADDYVCKPFSPRELVARVKAVLRRIGAVQAEVRVRSFGRLEIDERAREARVDGRAVTLKPREYALLAVLAQNAGVALSRERLLTRAWGFDFAGDERTVDVHVRRLRAKLEEPFSLPPLVETLHGFGYKFRRP